MSIKDIFSDNLQIHLPRSDCELHGYMNNVSQRWILVFEKATCLGTALVWELLGCQYAPLREWGRGRDKGWEGDTYPLSSSIKNGIWVLGSVCVWVQSWTQKIFPGGGGVRTSDLIFKKERGQLWGWGYTSNFHATVCLYLFISSFMPPAWKVRRGHLVIGSSVRPSVCPSVIPSIVRPACKQSAIFKVWVVIQLSYLNCKFI